MVNIIKQIIHNIQLSSSSSDVKKTLIKQNSNDTHILSITLYDKNDIITIDPDWKIALSAKKPDNTYVVNENKEKIEITFYLLTKLLDKFSIAFSFSIIVV